MELIVFVFNMSGMCNWAYGVFRKVFPKVKKTESRFLIDNTEVFFATTQIAPWWQFKKTKQKRGSHLFYILYSEGTTVV